MPAITITDLNNAKLDVDHIAEVATSLEPTATDRMANVKRTVKGAIENITQFNYRGDFGAGTAYAIKDLYVYGGVTYLALQAHTSSTVAADLASGKVGVYQGVTTADLANTDDIGKADALINIKQPLAGAVVRTQRDKNAEIISRADFADDASFAAAKVGRLSIGAAGELDSPVDGPFAKTTLVSAVSSAMTSSQAVFSRPAYIEQHISSFYGRGMLDGEVEGDITTQPMTAAASAGSALVQIANTAQYVVGGCVTILHDNGKYHTYFINGKSGTGLSIFPRLKYDCLTTGMVERTWYNKAHPGKFYMRQLAQRIAHITENDAAMPDGDRVLFTNFSGEADTLTPTGAASVLYFDAANTGESGTTTSAVRFALGRSAYVSGIAAVGDGAATPFFDVVNSARVSIKLMFYASQSTGNEYAVTLFDENSVALSSFLIPAIDCEGTTNIYTFQADVRAAKQLKVSVYCATFSSAANFIIDQIDIFRAPELAKSVISKTAAKIVCLGDSWVQGDLGNTPEREPITTQLALELPDAQIINSGVGGQRIWEMLERFDTDVAAHNPDYVVIVTGTNESLNPASGTFYPTAINEFLRYYRAMLIAIAGIGARAIVVGVPALSESWPGLLEWEPNDRARQYERYFYEWMANKPSAVDTSGQTITLTAGATPSVANASRVILDYTDATTITQLADGVKDQVVELEAMNGNVTLQQFPFLLTGTTNVTLTANSVITLRRRDPDATGAWVEVSRSIK